ncbi:uncharacterized protein LOC143230000 isoform X3 [Tachypleus tridentatus]|uniref:uncharacterized protein LOC143230000 isoform X3 n=1 Tax=Tachypleus tridentatus TaxID=6853 RepID=UPI003FD10683
MAYLLGDFYEQDCSVVVPESPKAELELYLEQKPIPCNESPFAWWRNEQSSYPTMSKLARTLLSIPGTSVPSERVFSCAGGTYYAGIITTVFSLVFLFVTGILILALKTERRNFFIPWMFAMSLEIFIFLALGLWFISKYYTNHNMAITQPTSHAWSN